MPSEGWYFTQFIYFLISKILLHILIRKQAAITSRNDFQDERLFKGKRKSLRLKTIHVSEIIALSNITKPRNELSI